LLGKLQKARKGAAWKKILKNIMFYVPHAHKMETFSCLQRFDIDGWDREKIQPVKIPLRL